MCEEESERADDTSVKAVQVKYMPNEWQQPQNTETSWFIPKIQIDKTLNDELLAWIYIYNKSQRPRRHYPYYTKNSVSSSAQPLDMIIEMIPESILKLIYCYEACINDSKKKC